MLNFKELLEQVQEVDVRGKVPTPKYLRESGIPVVASKTLDEETELMVYRNGYALYRVGKRATVFPICSCREYAYGFAKLGSSGEEIWQEIAEDYFCDKTWYFRLVLEGEDRLEHNQERRIGDKNISYSAVAEDWDVMGYEDTILEQMISGEIVKKTMREAICRMTDRQIYILQRYCLDGGSQAQIAGELGISSQAVSDQLRKARAKFMRIYQEISRL